MRQVPMLPRGGRMWQVLVVAACALAVASALAAPARAEVAPSLAGEGLVAGPNAFHTTANCNSDETGTISFSVDGVAGGPYPGTFTESGTITVGPPNLASGGNIDYTVTAIQASFTIVSGTTIIHGTKTLASLPEENLTNQGVCVNNPSIYLPEFDSGVAYQATIDTATGTFQDSGRGRIDGVDAQSGGSELNNQFSESFVVSNGVTQTNVVSSAISSNFNGTPIPAGDCIWFNGVLQPTGNLPSSPTTIHLRNAMVTFAANGTNYTVALPDSDITLQPNGQTSTIAYSGSWSESVPLSGDNVFLDGRMFPVPAGGLPGGINPVTWSGNFFSSGPVQFNWQWSAAVYTDGACTADMNQLGVKPIHSTTLDTYHNGDQAGTPENYKSDVTGGARGGGGSNYTGSYSGTAQITLR